MWLMIEEWQRKRVAPWTTTRAIPKRRMAVQATKTGITAVAAAATKKKMRGA
jgi:apolipoprotein N-acyltransferase